MRALYDSVETREGYIDRFGSVIDSVRVRLTADEIRALHTTPQVLISAPGPNKFIAIDQAVAYLDYSGGALVGTNDVEIRATNGAGNVLVRNGFAFAFLNGIVDAISVESGSAYWAETARALDEAVVAVIPVADPTGAASTSTLTIILFYKVVKVYN